MQIIASIYENVHTVTLYYNDVDIKRNGTGRNGTYNCAFL